MRAPCRRCSIVVLLFVAHVVAAGPSRASVAPPLPFLVATGAAPGDRFGTSVAARGDLNGDGFADIVIGAEWSDEDATNAGRAYVLFGGPSADGNIDLVLRPPAVEARALTGAAVAIPGDVNGDGWNDIAVGSPVSQRQGQVFLYWGGPSLDPVPDRTLGGLSRLEFFGASLSGVGDVNRDGYADIWVGAPRFVPFLSSAERVGRGYLFLGGPTADGVVDFLFNARPIGGITDQLQFGTSVAPAGDENGDGYADILVGQPADGTFNAGRAYIYYGGMIVHRVPDKIYVAPAFRYRAGTSVTRAGDFNGDGTEDYFLGGPDSGEGEALTPGRAYLYFGGQADEEAPATDMEFAGEGDDDLFGFAVAGGADVNGDGHPDLLVGAPFATGHGDARAGRVYVYHGGPGADAVADVVLEGQGVDANWGTSIALGDVNGDGVADAVIGAPGPLGSATGFGHVYVYDLVVPLRARAFPHDEHRALPLQEAGPPICLRLESVDGDFTNAEVDFTTIRLRAAGAAAVSVAPVPAKRLVESDRDGNGVPELNLCFERADLRRLFAGTRGRAREEVHLEGALLTGRRIGGAFEWNVVVAGRPEGPASSVSPNPMNPDANLHFTLRAPGPVSARLYDSRGRLIRTLVSGRIYPAGPHQLRIEGRDDRGRTLPSGVYAYRLDTSEGSARGRLVVAK
jgi:hypothetical protein